MRASVTSLTKKFLLTLFAVTLSLGLVPAAALAAENDPIKGEPQEEYIGESSASSDGEEAAGNIAETGEDSNLAIPAAVERVNEDVVLATPVAQQESTRSYFLAQTLESTRTVPMVSAQLPVDTGVNSDSNVSVEGDFEDEDGVDFGLPDSDDVVLADVNDGEHSRMISPESIVIGSFEQDGMVFTIESDGASVALMAVDLNKLSEDSIATQIIIIPESVTPEGIDYYSVTRIADNAFASFKKEKTNVEFVGFKALLSDEDCHAEIGMNDIDLGDDGSIADCSGILALGVPASIAVIEDDAFTGFETLQYIVVSEDSQSFASFDGALYSADLTQLRLIPEGRVGAIRVAPSATTVEPEVFSHCPLVDMVVADPDSRDTFDIWEDSLKDRGIEITYELGASIPSSLTILLEERVSDHLSKDTLAQLDDSRAIYNSTANITFSFRTDIDVPYTVTASNTSGAPSIESSYAGKTFTNSTPFSISGMDHWWIYSNVSGWLNCVTIVCTTDTTGARYDVKLTPVNAGYRITAGYANAASTDRMAPGIGSRYTTNPVYCKVFGNTYKVTFNSGAGKTTESSKTVTYNAAVPNVAIPTRTGYKFTGYYESIDSNDEGVGDAWFNDAGVYVKQKTSVDYTGEKAGARWGVAGTKTLYAGWTPTKTFSFDYDINYKVNATAVRGAPALDASVNTTVYNNSKPFSLAGITQWIRYNGNRPDWLTMAYGGGWSGKAYDVVVTPVCSGYSASLGFLSADATSYEWGGREDAIVYCKAIGNPYKVTFSPGAGATTEASKNVTYNAAVSDVAIPTRKGYTFTGYFESVDANGKGVGDAWFNDAGVYVKQKTSVDYTGEKAGARWGVADNKTLYAGWTPKSYTVNYEYNYTDSPVAQSQTRSYNASANPLSASRDGYELLGWSRTALDPLAAGEDLPDGCLAAGQPFSMEDDLHFSEDVIPASFELYAVWRIVPYTLTIKTTGSQTTGMGTMALTESLSELEDVKLSDDERTITATYTYESPDIELPSAATSTLTPADGWSFKSWSLSVDGGAAQTGSGTLANHSMGNRVYTAVWESGETYDITYQLGEENGSKGRFADGATHPASYKVEDASFTISAPVMDGYWFVGWTVDDGTGSKTVLAKDDNGDETLATIPQGSYGDKTLTANWKPVLYTVTLKVADGALPAVANATFESGIPASLQGSAFKFSKDDVRKADGTSFTADQVTTISSDNKTITVPFTYESAEIALPTGLQLSGLWTFSSWKDASGVGMSSIGEKSHQDYVLTASWIPIVSVDMPLQEGSAESQLTLYLDVATGTTGTAINTDQSKVTRTLFRTKTPVPAKLSARSTAPVIEQEGATYANDDYAKAFFDGPDGDVSSIVSSMRYAFAATDGIDATKSTGFSLARRSGSSPAADAITVLPVTTGTLDANGYVEVKGTLDLILDTSKINDTVRIRQMEDPTLTSVLENMDSALKRLSTIVWTVDATGWDED